MKTTPLALVAFMATLPLAMTEAADGDRWIAIDVDGNAAIHVKAHFNQTTATNFTYTVTLTGEGDFGSLILYHNYDTGYLNGIGPFGTSSFMPEASLGALGRSLRMSTALPQEPQDQTYVLDNGVRAAGNWSFVFMSGALAPISRVRLQGDFDPAPVSWSWETIDEIGIATNREFDEGTYAAVGTAGLGVGIAVDARKTLGFDRGFVGFSKYVPSMIGYDDHEFNVQAGGNALKADNLAFLGQQPGDYTFELDQVAAGDSPGRVFILHADFSLSSPWLPDVLS